MAFCFEPLLSAMRRCRCGSSWATGLQSTVSSAGVHFGQPGYETDLLYLALHRGTGHGWQRVALHRRLAVPTRASSTGPGAAGSLNTHDRGEQLKQIHWRKNPESAAQRGKHSHACWRYHAAGWACTKRDQPMPRYKLAILAAFVISTTPVHADGFRYQGSPKFGQFYQRSEPPPRESDWPAKATTARRRTRAFDAQAMSPGEQRPPEHKGGIGSRTP